MTRRMGLLLATAGVLSTLFMLDRFVLDRADTNTLSEPVTRTEKQNGSPLQNIPASNARFLAPLAEFDEIWLRPVLMSSRKPVPVIAGPRTQSKANQSSDQPPDFKIVGVALGPKNSAALIRTDRRTIKRYYIQDIIDGWTIDDIKPDSITVTRDDERWMLPVGTTD